MKLSYDPRCNIAYIALKEKSAQVRTIKISDDVNIDIASDGTLFGVELLNANEQLRGDDMSFRFVNEASGASRNVELPL